MPEFAKGIKTEDDLNQFTRLLTKLTVETALNAELTEHLGHEKNARKSGSNSRNGYSSKIVLSDDGEIEITTPRDRDGTFEPQLIKKNQTRITQMDSQILSLYAEGMTTREIVATFKEMYDADVSPTLISKVTDAVNEQVAEWQNRPLDVIYPIVYMDCIVVKVRHNGSVINKAVFLALGINLDGHKELLGMWMAENEGAKFERKLKLALSHINNSEYEFRFQKLADVISILDRASSSSTANNLESLRLLDPRYQMSFYAEEVDAQSGDIRDVLESSSGKSGGEKEAFAGTIVAASLAYVLTPDGYDYPIYSTVFLDEAFSNTAEAVSRRVLRVFKALKIHVNLITPYKNLNLARESARSLLIAERDISSHESHLCEVTWKDIDEKLKRNRQQLHAEAEQLGIQINV